ncbi:MAG TPA: threonine/serine dehydratase [Gemmatimonadales bacterium]|jgi:threonine dehydratase|nr:threonine/serine dehydratase [Gemmatimonadales bacterium]
MRPDEAAAEVAAAERRIRRYIRETPLEPSPALSKATGADVYLKLETAQVTGSFKARGAFSKLLALSPSEREAGVVTASTGNHALATAHALSVLGIPGEIFLPASVSPAKLDALQSRGAQLRLVDDDPGLVETIARRAAGETGRVYVSPYNDPQVIGGQGTVAVELGRQLPGLDAVFVPVGGGGLVGGIAAHFAAHAPGVDVVGCQPLACPIMIESIRAGRLLELPSAPSISDATVGLLEPGSITFPLCQELVSEWVGVAEADLRAAVRFVLERQSVLVEGAAALAVAALLAQAERWRGARVVLVLSGSHIAMPVLAGLLADS